MSRAGPYKQMNLSTLGQAPPPRYLGITHKAVETVPDRCPKCGEWWGLRQDGRWIYCRLCGEDFYLVSDRMVDIRRVGKESGSHYADEEKRR